MSKVSITYDSEVSVLDDDWIAGPLRSPAQMLHDQSYDGHKSIHDDDTADRLGFRAGPIEGPTHFSQFDPPCVEAFGQEWHANGCISAHFRNMVVEGERCRAFLKKRSDSIADIRMEKEDGTEVLAGTASIGTADETALRARLGAVRPLEAKIIMRDVEVGLTSPRMPIHMHANQHMGDLYPFTLEQKLEKISERPIEADAAKDAAPIIPMEMISVLAHYTANGFPVRGPVVGLFADLEIRVIDGPLRSDEEYEVEKEVVALSGSRRTESLWVESRIYRSGADTPCAIVLLNSASLKDSFKGYAEEEAALAAA